MILLLSEASLLFMHVSLRSIQRAAVLVRHEAKALVLPIQDPKSASYAKSLATRQFET